MQIVFDIEIMWLNNKPQILLDPEIIQTHKQLKDLIKQRLKVLADEMREESYGIIVVQFISTQKITAVGFSQPLASKIENSFTEDDFQYWAKKVSGEI